MTSKIYITTGAESSGKSTLAQDLSLALNAPLTKEASRDYLNQKLSQQADFQYRQQDLLEIAKAQFKNEKDNWLLKNKAVISDTDLLVIIVWSEEKYGTTAPWIVNTFESQMNDTARHYFLCHWDIPWQPDPLRENPNDRERLFNIYKKKLEDYQLSHTIIEGNPQQRLAAALSHIQN